MRTHVVKLSSLAAAAAVAGIAAVAAVGPMAAAAKEQHLAAEPRTLVEDFSYPGAAAIEAAGGPKLIGGDGRITYVEQCDDSDPTLIKLETLTNDVCFAVKGDTGWLSLRVEAVFLLSAGDQDVAAKVEGLDKVVQVPEGTLQPVRAVDPTRRGVVVELRASAPKA